MNWTRFWLAVGAALILAIGLTGPAAAGCSVSTTPVSFGSYDVFGWSPTDSTGSVTYQCGVGDVNIRITLDKGSAASFEPRQMLNGSRALGYNLYLNAARTAIWGDGTGGTQAYVDPAPTPGQAVTVTIYGRIPPRQDVPVGTYADTITATINF